MIHPRFCAARSALAIALAISASLANALPTRVAGNADEVLALLKTTAAGADVPPILSSAGVWSPIP